MKYSFMSFSAPDQDFPRELATLKAMERESA